MNVGEKIKAARLAKGLTQEELGNIVGVQKSAIAKYENGRVVNIKRSTLQALAQALGLRGSDLIIDSTSDSKEKPSEDEKTAPELSESVKKLISVMSQLTPENQRIVLAAAKGFLQEQNEGEDK